MDIYVGNLSYDCTENDLETAFGEHGSVSSAKVIRDRETGRSRGFGFVEMPNDNEARAAMEALNDAEHMGRRLTVNQARGKQGGGGGGGSRW